MEKFTFLVFAILALLFAPAFAQTEVVGGDMGTYRIHSNVDGAKVFMDGEYKGLIENDILDVPVMITGTPYRSFTVEKDGYKPYSGPINTVPSKGQVINLYATLSALPVTEYGTLHLLITPSLSTVRYDGMDAGIVPPNGILILREVIPGNHVITVSKEGFLDNTTEIFMQKNDIMKISIVLQPIESGPLSVTSTPPGAQVILDGQAVGITPLTVQDVTGGTHSLRLTLNGYSDYEETIVLTSEGASVAANLTPQPTRSGFGQIPLSPVTLIASLFVLAILYRQKLP
jgi:hypothetical protein